MDELAAACSAGYAEARAELAGETSQLRRRLLDLLTASSAPPLPAIAGLARAAGWPLPRRVAAVALSPLAASSPGLLAPDVLADLTRRDPCLLIPDPDGPGRRRQIAATLRGWLAAAGHAGGDQSLAAAASAVRPPVGPLAAVGPAVPLSAASGSLRWAGQALALARRGLVGPEDDAWRAAGEARVAAGEAAGVPGVVWCEDHLPTLVLLADADLAATLSREALAPLRPLRPGQADRLARTLLAWIESAATPTPPPAACKSTRRPSATGYGRSASCSATPSTTPTTGSGCCLPCGSAGSWAGNLSRHCQPPPF